MTDNPFVTNGYAGPGMSLEGSLSINITYPLPVPSSLPLKVCLKKTLSRTMVTNTLYTPILPTLDRKAIRMTESP